MGKLESDLTYFQKRMAEELEKAASAADDAVMRVHLRLAEQYSRRVAEAGGV
jgi:hypothetical protein